MRKPSGQQTALVVLVLLVVAGVLFAQGSSFSATPSSTSQAGQKDQSIPDAPSAVQPAKPAPPPPAASDSQTEPPPANQAPPSSDSGSSNGRAPENNPEARPPINIRTVPEGGATAERSDGQEKPYTLPPVRVDQVIVPVTVKDESGRLLNGLTSKNFQVLENGKKQTLNFFTSDPFALSAAVVLDLGMKDVDVQKVSHTFSALEGAFSQFDEVSVYSYSNTVAQLTGFGAVGQALEARLEELSTVRGQNNGPPVTSGPFGPNGPSINGIPADPGASTVYTPVQEAHVLNDAILRAAMDLSKRDRNRRKIIFVITDGREYRSNASYRDVLRLLLTQNIIVYGIGLGGSSIPGYSKLEKLHIPRLGYSDILPKFINATGGQVFPELTRSGIEDAYAQALGDARNQYTMGYISHAPPVGSYRSLEVLVDRPSCKSSIRPCVNVYAPDGYYPAAR